MTARELVSDTLEQRIGALVVGMVGEGALIARPLELRRDRFSLAQHFFEGNFAVLDGEQSRAKFTGRLERRRTGAQPARGESNEAQQVVRVLGAKLPCVGRAPATCARVSR